MTTTMGDEPLVIGNDKAQGFEPARKTTVTMVEVSSFLADKIGYSVTFHRYIGTNYLGGIWGKAPVRKIRSYRIKPGNRIETLGMRWLNQVITKAVRDGNASVTLNSTGYEAEIY